MFEYLATHPSAVSRGFMMYVYTGTALSNPQNYFSVYQVEESSEDVYFEIDSDINRRAIIFKSNLGYSYVENKVLSALNKTLAEIKNIYPDTYNFLMSLKDGLPEAEEY